MSGRPSNDRDASLNIRIAGTTAPGFEPVREKFAANFQRDDEYREIGAALTVFRGEDCVVDLWGGHADAARTREWQHDTLLNVFSTTKGIAATCVALLVERGVLKYEDKVSSLWPEFARGGKEHATIAHVLSHQVGLPAFEDPLDVEDLYDVQARCEALARQQPRWTPGEKTGYHPITFGYLVGEIVRRATGESIGRFLATQLADPLRADFHIGLPERLEPNVAETVEPKRRVDFASMPGAPETRLALTNPSWQPSWPNTREWRAAELPALNGHASAMGIARIYAMLANGGLFAGKQLLSAATIARMTQVESRRLDLTLGVETGWTCGYLRNGPSGLFGPNRRAFGHPGWGGSFGCADSQARLAIGYACNQMSPNLAGDVRALELCAAIYRCL